MRKGPIRTFDYDEAARLRSEGLTYSEIGERFGVTDAAIQRAVNPKRRAEMLARTAAFQRSGICPDCGGQASRNGLNLQHRCRSCASKLAATSVMPRSLRCAVCRVFKLDDDFPRHRRRQHRRGRHTVCRACQAAVRQQSRERRKVPCKNCGKPRTHPSDNGEGTGRRNTGLCLDCFREGVRAL